MHLTPGYVPPLYIGAIREKTLQLAGRVGDGTLLPEMSSPAYMRWAQKHIQVGMAESGRLHHRTVVYLFVKVNRDSGVARAAMRQCLARRLQWTDVQLNPLGIEAEVAAFKEAHSLEEMARQMPDEWVDALSAAGTPEQAAESIQCWIEAGVDSIVFQPIDGDPDCLDEYTRYLLPLLKPKG
jgi:5,10-methylenetetrahydromethanopterin reductase